MNVIIKTWMATVGGEIKRIYGSETRKQGGGK